MQILTTCISSYEARYGVQPDYKRMQPFGQACTAMFSKKRAPNKKQNRGAITNHSMAGIMVGYDDANGTKAYRVLCTITEEDCCHLTRCNVHGLATKQKLDRFQTETSLRSNITCSESKIRQIRRQRLLSRLLRRGSAS